MSKAQANKRIFRIREGNFSEEYAFVESLLNRKDVNDETAKETLLVFEALMQKLIDWGVGEDADIEIRGSDGFGDFHIEVKFGGKVFSLGDGDAASIEDMILKAHDDKLSFNYIRGYNTISISVRRSDRTSIIVCVISCLCAVIVYIPLSIFVDADNLTKLSSGYVYPIEKMYANAMLMIGAPMTFFSLMKNLTNTYVVSQRSSGVQRLQKRTLVTSVFAIILALASFMIMSSAISLMESSLYGSVFEFTVLSDRSFSDIVGSFVPSSIFEPFEAVSPIPLMLVALLCTYAMCSAGKYFADLQHAMMACYTLFSRMLAIVISALPAFCFISVMDLLLVWGYNGLIELLGYVVAACMGIALLLFTYAIRLRAHGVKVTLFVRKIVPLIIENYKIGSAIDAAQYNIRFCSKSLKMNREMLERDMPVLAEINLDGNCFLLMFFTLAFCFTMGIEVSWISLAGLSLLILFLSLGAPNQPGSILIGMLIIITYVNSMGALGTAIILEALFGAAQNLINVVGDIVMVAIEDSKENARAE